MSTNRELVVREPDLIPALNAAELRARVQLIQQVMASVMKPNVHYGVIPGTQKPSLWKAGAEKLAMTFGISITTEVVEERISDDEVAYRVRAHARSQSGADLGATEGLCSTREKKYRWRTPTHPKEFDAAPDTHRQIVFESNGNEKRQVRMAAGDVANTILQMADKRAYVALVRKVTAASDIFAQDLEDVPAEALAEEEKATAAAAPVQQPTRATEATEAAPATEGGPAPVRIANVKRAKSGTKKDGTPWTLFIVTTSDGAELTTFSTSIAAIAQKAVIEEKAVQITSTPVEGKSPQIDTIQLVG